MYSIAIQTQYMYCTFLLPVRHSQAAAALATISNVIVAVSRVLARYDTIQQSLYMDEGVAAGFEPGVLPHDYSTTLLTQLL